MKLLRMKSQLFLSGDRYYPGYKNLFVVNFIDLGKKNFQGGKTGRLAILTFCRNFILIAHSLILSIEKLYLKTKIIKSTSWLYLLKVIASIKTIIILKI